MTYNINATRVGLDLAAGKKRIRLEARIYMDRLVDCAVARFTADFWDDVNSGQLMALDSNASITYLIAAEKELEAGDEARATPPDIDSGGRTADPARLKKRARDSRYRARKRLAHANG